MKTVQAGARVWPDVRCLGPGKLKAPQGRMAWNGGSGLEQEGLAGKMGEKITYTGTGRTGKYTRSQFFQCLRWKLQVHREKKLGPF